MLHSSSFLIRLVKIRNVLPTLVTCTLVCPPALGHGPTDKRELLPDERSLGSCWKAMTSTAGVRPAAATGMVRKDF